MPGAILGRIAPAAEVGTGPVPRRRPGPRRRRRRRNDAAWTPAFAGEQSSRETRLSPSVKRAVLQHDLDPEHIEGTGRDGRITRADVDRAVEQATKVASPSKASSPPRPATSAPTSSRTTACASPSPRTCTRSVTDAPHVTAVFEADFSAIMAHREAHKAAFAKKGVKLTYTAYLVAAAAEAMKVAPAINSRWHADKLELYDDINIGVGTALGEKGLIVPVVRKVQQLILKGIAAQLDELIEKARKEKLTARRHQGRHLHHLQSRRLRLALRRADHHQPAAIGDPRRRQAGEARRRPRGRRRRRDPDPPDGLCHRSPSTTASSTATRPTPG